MRHRLLHPQLIAQSLHGTLDTAIAFTFSDIAVPLCVFALRDGVATRLSAHIVNINYELPSSTSGLGRLIITNKANKTAEFAGLCHNHAANSFNLKLRFTVDPTRRSNCNHLSSLVVQPVQPFRPSISETDRCLRRTYGLVDADCIKGVSLSSSLS